MNSEASTRARATVVLIVDDSPQDREVFRRFLSADPRTDYEFHERDAIEPAVEACRELQPDCILLDYSLSDGTGLDFLAAFEVAGHACGSPVVMLTGSGNERIAAQAFRAGAQDYLIKEGLQPEVLQRAVATAIYTARTQRTLDAQRAELERLFVEAQRAHARKDVFLAALSHELRTPLTPILTAVSSLDVRQASLDELEEVFAMIRRNVRLEARLIDDLLDLTRVANGKLNLELQDVDAHEMLRHALRTCHEEITAKELEVSHDFAAEAFQVRADPARLQQVFWNLLKNAVKFTPHGGRISISTRNPEPSRWEAELRDSGVGISPEILPRIFDAFEQGEADAMHRSGGLGLGLAISKGIMDALDGGLRAESAGPGRGASFIVALPATRSTAAAVPPTLSPVAHEVSTARASTGVLAVLLVEDHADSARLLARSIRRSGFHVLTATTAAEARAVFDREAIDIVVSDIGLPDGDGLELMSELRAKRPVTGIALSGYGMQQDIQRSREAGFAEHITKPVDWPQLERALLRMAGRGDA